MYSFLYVLHSIFCIGFIVMFFYNLSCIGFVVWFSVVFIVFFFNFLLYFSVLLCTPQMVLYCIVLYFE